MVKQKKKEGNTFPVVAIVFGGILILISIAFIIGNSSFKQSTELSNEPIVSDETGVARISVEEAKLAYDKSEAIFLDVRGSDSYSRRHIEGAISIPLNELEKQIQSLNPDSWIITYCT